MKGGENQAPKIYKIKTSENPQALVSSSIEAQAYDDGAPDGKLTYKWETVKEPEDGELTFDAKNKPYANITASKDGIYKVKLTVSDGELSTEKEVEIEIGRAPEKTAPITSRTQYHALAPLSCTGAGCTISPLRRAENTGVSSRTSVKLTMKIKRPITPRLLNTALMGQI